MFSILHKIVIEASPKELLNAISSEVGLSQWWTKAKSEGNNVRFYFGPNGEHQIVMSVLNTQNDNEIRWQCVEGPWVDKGEFVFSVLEHERGLTLDFAHHGWAETDDFYKHCNGKWGFFLVVSLKQFLETGKGQPHPQDPSI